MYQTIFTIVSTGIGAGVGNYFDSPILGGVIGFIFALGCITGALGEAAECIVDCID